MVSTVGFLTFTLVSGPLVEGRTPTPTVVLL